MENIGQRLRAIRQNKGMKLTAVAQIAGISQASLSFIETGQNSPTVDTLSRILAALDLSLSDFFGSDFTDLPPDIQTLISAAKNLTPEQVDILNQLLKTMTESSSTQDIHDFAQEAENDPLPYEPGEVLAAHRTDDPTRDLPTAALKNIAAFKEACRREVFEEPEMEIKSKRNKKGPA